MTDKAEKLGNEGLSYREWIGGSTSNPKKYIEYGLTKRELFAAMAMQGILSGQLVEDPENTAYNAVLYADNLLEELSKTE